MDFHIYDSIFNGMNDKGTTKLYVFGFALSILLTLAAYFSVVNKLFSGMILTAFITALALVQLMVQLIFFLHLGQESKPRWKQAIFLSTVSIILVIIIGSLWIMSNLNYHNMSPGDTNNYILKNEGIYH